MAMKKAFPESLVLLKHQRIKLDDDNKSPSTIQFHMRSNCKHQKISSVPQEIEEEEFIHNEFKSYVVVLKLLTSSSLEIDSRVLEWIISDITEKTSEILLNNVTEGKKRWLIDVEILDNGIGFPYEKLCNNCSAELSEGWTDYCQTCLQFM